MIANHRTTQSPPPAEVPGIPDSGPSRPSDPSRVHATADRAGTELAYAEWMARADVEYQRLQEQLGGLGSSDWAAPTDCAGWDVRDVVAHLSGAAASNASLLELARQARRGAKLLPGRDGVDQMNAAQVEARADWPASRVLADFAANAERGLRARRRIPGPVRALRIPFGPPLGTQRLDYLMGRIYTRDAWMHRVDIHRATGAPLVLDAEHDGAIVGDVVAEWARGMRTGFTLRLAGPAGGSWRRDASGEDRQPGNTPAYELDAVEVARALSGRGTTPRPVGLRFHF